MGTLNFWEVNDNHIPTAITVLLNHFKLYFLLEERFQRKRRKRANFLKPLLLFLCYKWMGGNFEFAVDTFTILNPFSATKRGG